jgi:uncharacterized membrane protein YwzB
MEMVQKYISVISQGIFLRVSWSFLQSHRWHKVIDDYFVLVLKLKLCEVHMYQYTPTSVSNI